MKQLTTNLMAAAVVALAAGSASAQTLKADIPFTFHVAGVVMTPGPYEISNASNIGVEVRDDSQRVTRGSGAGDVPADRSRRRN